jgi:hypothetical protein
MTTGHAVENRTNPVENHPNPGHDVEACANAVLDQLPAHVAEAVRETSLVFNRYPLWVTVAGLVLKAFENGDHQAPILDPGWSRQLQVEDPIAHAKYKCEQCASAFRPIRYRQRYCSDECGRVAAAAIA